jgi:multimeric flavodoxin WrbA
MYGHVYKMAEAVAAGAREATDTEVSSGDDVPYSEQRQMRLDEITGGSPYGASTITGGDGSRQPSENELSIARFQGKHVATLAGQLKRGRG